MILVIFGICDKFGHLYYFHGKIFKKISLSKNFGVIKFQKFSSIDFRTQYICEFNQFSKFHVKIVLNFLVNVGESLYD